MATGSAGPLSVKRIKEAVRQVMTETEKTEISILTNDVVESFLRHKKHAGITEDSLKTYQKRLAQFVQQFPILPHETDVIIGYLSQFDGGTGRYKRNHQDLISALYNHSVHYFNVLANPLRYLERPRVIKKPIRTLSLEEAKAIDAIVGTPTERVSWELALCHGWRQIEIRRITAGDICSISQGVVLCRGKERIELTPVLPDTKALLEYLAEGLQENECVVRSTRIRHGKTQPLGTKGMMQLFQRLFLRAGIEGVTGHDLRRTFCTMVRDASGDELLAMRLARDIVPGVSDRYINTDPVELGKDLSKYSPLNLLRHSQDGETQIKEGESLVEAGESRTPRPRKVTQDILQA